MAAVAGASTEKPLNVIEKILLHHAVGLQSKAIKPGDVLCVKVDWTMANEITWKGMRMLWRRLGEPKPANPERVWLSVDHSTDPRINHEPKPLELTKLVTQFAREHKIVDFFPPNTSIMHTEFARQRSQPGQIVIGADSHTCSGGGMGAFAVGLGAGDVVLPLVTGRTWFRVPETIRIELKGRPAFGISGKDVMLHILGKLKRNTVALGRAVEYGGPGMKYLSCDARFALANMATEFGALAGVCVADAVTAAALAKRERVGKAFDQAAKGCGCSQAAPEVVGDDAERMDSETKAKAEAAMAEVVQGTTPGSGAAKAGDIEADGAASVTARAPSSSAAAHTSEALYFQPDDECEYAGVYEIDLGEVSPAVARYPDPDNCVPVNDPAVKGKPLDGCFIGACTTAQEELVLAALVLEQALRQGRKPAVATATGMGKAPQRRVTPGSVYIYETLERHGLLDVYRRAGFTVGSPGCSFCLGIAADVAQEGEIWLSSQNRNFKDRMGRGSIGSLASAATVAASSLGMAVEDPTPFLKGIDPERFEALRGELRVGPPGGVRALRPLVGAGIGVRAGRAAVTIEYDAEGPAVPKEDPAGAGAAAAAAAGGKEAEEEGEAKEEQVEGEAGAAEGASDAVGLLAPEAPRDDALVTWTEPQPELATGAGGGASAADDDAAAAADGGEPPVIGPHLPTSVKGAVQRFGAHVDTDAIIPGPFLACSAEDRVKHGERADMTEDEFLGAKCFAYARPEFRGRVKEGRTVVVAGEGFGSGSSREEAVRALRAAGVGAVVARSFAFIYGRNQPNNNLLGVTVSSDRFYELAQEGSTVEVDVPNRQVTVWPSSSSSGEGGSAGEGATESFPFELSLVEERFLQAGGVERLYKRFGAGLFEAVLQGKTEGCVPDDKVEMGEPASVKGRDAARARTTKG